MQQYWTPDIKRQVQYIEFLKSDIPFWFKYNSAPWYCAEMFLFSRWSYGSYLSNEICTHLPSSMFVARETVSSESFLKIHFFQHPLYNNNHNISAKKKICPKKFGEKKTFGSKNIFVPVICWTTFIFGSQTFDIILTIPAWTIFTRTRGPAQTKPNLSWFELIFPWHDWIGATWRDRSWPDLSCSHLT